MFWPSETRTSTCRNFATISSGLYRFLAIAVLLDVKDIPQVGPLQRGRTSRENESRPGPHRPVGTDRAKAARPLTTGRTVHFHIASASPPAIGKARDE